MTEFTPAQAQEYLQGGMEQLDYLLIREEQAKLASLVTMASGLNVVFVGQPGGGKTTLAQDMHRLVDGIQGNQIAVIPPLSDLSPQQTVGGDVVVSKSMSNGTNEEGWLEESKTTIEAILKPETQVIFANEINRVNPFAINAMLEALEQKKIITSGTVKEMDRLEFVVSTMNPSERHEATFRMMSASASRHAIGAVLGSDPETREEVIYKVLGGWEPQPEKMEPVISLDELHALRRVAREQVAIPENIKRHAVERIIDVTKGLRDHHVDEADARISKHVSLISRTLAALRAQETITEVELAEALSFVVVARLGILSTGNVHAQAKEILG